MPEVLKKKQCYYTTSSGDYYSKRGITIMFLLAFISSGLIATSQLSSFLILLPCDLWQCYCCSWKDHRRGNWSKSRWKKKKKQRGRDFPPKVFELAHTNARISKELLLATTQPLLKKLLVDEARMVVLNSQALWSVLFTQYCKSWEEEGKRESSSKETSE